MTVEQVAAEYVKVSEAARLLTTDGDRWDSARVYRSLQSDAHGLEALCVGGWAVSRKSIRRYIAKRERQTVTA